MKKIILILSAVLFILVIGVGGHFLVFEHPAPLRSRDGAPGKESARTLTPPTQAANPDYWQVEADIRLYHFARGKGRDVLVIHGGPGVPFRKAWTGLESLSGAYRFYYYDQRGCGKSTRPIDHFESRNYYQNMVTLDQTLGLGAQIADIERIRRILGDDQLILIGHSWGGFLASLYAAEFPEHVKALVLVSPATALVMPQKESDLFTSVRQHLPENRQAEYDAFIKDYLDFGALFQKSEADLVALNNRFGAFYQEAIAIQLPEHGETGGWMAWGMYASLGQRHDYLPALRQTAIPVLVLHGSNDLQSETANRQYAEIFPKAQFKVIQNATHFPFEEQPAQLGELITRFLSDR